MVVERKSGEIQHLRCSDLPDLFTPRDLLVLNQSRVFPARLHGACGERRVEILLLHNLGRGAWEVLLKPGRRLKPGHTIVLDPGRVEATVREGGRGPIREVEFRHTGSFWSWLEQHGEVPLPPYIRRPAGESDEDRTRYQTVYARYRGSIAAPTAGLHFNKEMLARIRHCFITLHVGYGTFKPVTVSNIEDHQVDPEHFSVSKRSAETISGQIARGETVTAVGTTTTRVLEHLNAQQGRIAAARGSTELYIYPGFQFGVVGKLLTNFHLPRSSLLMLVAAFAGLETIRMCYRVAVEEKYRFYSYGDAMLIL